MNLQGMNLLEIYVMLSPFVVLALGLGVFWVTGWWTDATSGAITPPNRGAAAQSAPSSAALRRFLASPATPRYNPPETRPPAPLEACRVLKAAENAAFSIGLDEVPTWHPCSK